MGVPTDALLSHLAASLSHCGQFYSAAGQRQEALATTLEAAQLYAVAVTTRSTDAFEPELAKCLSSLGLRYAAVGERNAALAATQDAVALLRRLGEGLTAGRPPLVGPLGAHRVRVCGRPRHPAPPRLRAHAAARNPREYESLLASALNNLANRLHATGRRDSAFDIIQEAVSGAVQRPARRGVARLKALDCPSRRSTGQHPAKPVLCAPRCSAPPPPPPPPYTPLVRPPTVPSLQVFRYSVLATRDPDAYGSDMAKPLINAGMFLSELGHPTAALAATLEAVEMCRKLVERSGGDALKPDLAKALNNVSGRRCRHRRHAARVVARRLLTLMWAPSHRRLACSCTLRGRRMLPWPPPRRQ